MSVYDLIVIGGGPGGYVAAIRAAQLGLKTAVVERRHLGGVCLNWGCIPTKSLLNSTELLGSIRRASQFGVSAGEIGIDLRAMVARSRQIAGQLNGGVQFLLRKNKVDVIWGRAEIIAPGQVIVHPVEGELPKGMLPPGSYQAANIIIATGARGRSLPGIVPDGQRIWSYEHAMHASEIPASLVIVGAGAIGVEFADFYQALGTRVTLIERLPQILPHEDGEIAELMAKALKKKGVEIVLGARIESLISDPTGVSARLRQADDAESIVQSERLLVAVGVVGNVENLGLEKLGVAFSNGVIKTGIGGATSVAGIYAIGDVAGPPLLAHKAEHEGIIAAETIAAGRGGHALGPIPSCIYAHPQIASIGLTEAQVATDGVAVDVGRFHFRGNGKAVTLGETDGMVKVLFDTQSGRLVGAHMLGSAVSEMIAVFSLAMTLGATRAQMEATIFPHPTLSEALHEAILASHGCVIHQ